jgi:hypothetical protein
MYDNMWRLHPRGAASRGICVDADGAMLGPDCVLVGRTTNGFRAIERAAAASIQKCLAASRDDRDWLFDRCQHIADLLDKGELALAQIYGLHLSIGALDDAQLKRIARVHFAKAGFNPDEPRIPKGDHGGGEWTDGGGSSPDASPSNLLTDAAYQGTYHNIVVAEVAAYLRSKGLKVITEVDLIARNGARTRADIIAVKVLGGPLLLVEVKTGNEPRYTPRQGDVYPMAQIGDHVFSPNPKIETLGYSTGQWLPPMTFATIYKYDAKSDYEWLFH